MQSKRLSSMLARLERRSRQLAVLIVISLFIGAFLIGPGIKKLGLAGETKDIVYDYQKWYLVSAQGQAEVVFNSFTQDECEKFAKSLRDASAQATCYRGDEMQMRKYEILKRSTP